MKLTLVDSNLNSCVENNIIQGINNLDIKTLIQPSSIDIPLGSKAYLLPKRALSTNQDIGDVASKIALQEFDLNQETLFLKHHTYLVETDIEVNLPENISAKCSPKSSIGRIDVLVRSVCSNHGMYDTIFKNSKGKLYLEITPQSFNIIVKKGVPMSQIRLFEETNKTQDFIEQKRLLNQCIKTNLSQELLYDENIVFLGLEINENNFGFVAKKTQKPINLTKIKEHNPDDFFEKLTARVDESNELHITIEKDKFYIFHTSEKISVPKTHSIEMLPYSHLIGDFRAHYAGFFDPGFGGENGAIGVLEVRSYEDIVIYPNQPICAIQIYQNLEIPNISYGECGNNYQGQTGPRLSKFFK